MTIEPTFHETRLAVIERRRPDVLIIRYHEDAAFDVVGIAEVIATCERITGEKEFGMISALPNDGEINLESMQHEHSTEGMNQRVRAHALVASEGLLKKLATIHYNYHPQQHQVHIFGTVEEAVEWVQARLDDRSVA
ncbi:MAG: hypothetical protein JNM62_00820 [Flavobacteriales bacterium]|nr:hypothetical protein [Flavobacteriales bacterium]